MRGLLCVFMQPDAIGARRSRGIAWLTSCGLGRYTGELTITIPRKQKAQPTRIPVTSDPAAGRKTERIVEQQPS